MVSKLSFFNGCFDKGRLKSLISWSLINCGEQVTIELVEKLKNLGFEYATQAGISLSLDDLKIPPSKPFLVSEAELEIKSTQIDYYKGNLTAVEKFQQLIDTWHRTSETLKQNVIQHFRSTDVLNPVYMMAFSGARGNISQVRQLVGMRGLMADPQGQIIDFPIQSNFREGLTLTEYVISCYGARKGLVDTALRTANSGYLTRRLVDVSQHVIVCQLDCGTSRGIILSDMSEGNKIILSLQNRLVGRILGENIYTKSADKSFNEINNTKLLASKNEEISATLAAKITKLKKQVLVRSPLTCEAKSSICQLCYGWSLAHGNLVSLGEAVGILAAQSIGEPGTQLTMRTFHTGGVFSGDVMQEIRAPFDGIIEFLEPLQGILIRTSHGKIAFLTKIEGEFSIQSRGNTTTNENLATKDFQKNYFKIPAATILFVRKKEFVFERQLIAEFSSMSAQSNQRIQAKHNLNSDMEGQIFFEDVILGLKIGKEGDITRTARKLGSMWILSGKIYQTRVPSCLFPQTGDLLDENSIINQVTVSIPYNGFLDTNKKKLIGVLKQNYFQYTPITNKSLKINKIYSQKSKSFLSKNKFTNLKKLKNTNIKVQLVDNSTKNVFFNYPFLSFPVKAVQYHKIGYFFSFCNQKQINLKVTSVNSNFVELETNHLGNRFTKINSDSEKVFLSNSLKQEFTDFAKMKKFLYLQSFPTNYKTKTGGLLYSDNLYLQNDYSSGQIFWIPEEMYQFNSKNFIDPNGHFTLSNKKFFSLFDSPSTLGRFSKKISFKNDQSWLSNNFLYFNFQGKLNNFYSKFNGWTEVNQKNLIDSFGVPNNLELNVSSAKFLKNNNSLELLTESNNTFGCFKKNPYGLVLKSTAVKNSHQLKNYKKLFFKKKIYIVLKDYKLNQILLRQNIISLLKPQVPFLDLGLFSFNQPKSKALATNIESLQGDFQKKVKSESVASKKVFNSAFNFFSNTETTTYSELSKQAKLQFLKKKSFKKSLSKTQKTKFQINQKQQFDLNRKVLQIKIKPGWIYFPINQKQAINLNGCILKPGSNFIDNISFDQQPIYFECIPFKKLSIKSKEKIFNKSQLNKKNLFLKQNSNFLSFYKEFSLCNNLPISLETTNFGLARQFKNSVSRSKTLGSKEATTFKTKLLESSHISKNLDSQKTLKTGKKKAVTLDRLLLLLKKTILLTKICDTNKDWFNQENIFLANLNFTTFFKLGKKHSFCFGKIYLIKNINSRYLSLLSFDSYSPKSKTLAVKSSAPAFIRDELIDKTNNLSILRVSKLNRNSFDFDMVSIESSKALKNTFFIASSEAKKNLSQVNETSLYTQSFFHRISFKPQFFVLLRKVNEYSLYSSFDYKKLLSQKNQFVTNFFLKHSFYSAFKLTHLPWFNKQNATKLFLSFPAVDFKVQSSFRFKNPKSTHFYRKTNILEFFVLINIPKKFPLKKTKIQFSAKQLFSTSEFLKLKINRNQQLNLNKVNLFNTKLITEILSNLSSIPLTSSLDFLVFRKIDLSSFMVSEMKTKTTQITNTKLLVYPQNYTFNKNPLSLTCFFSPYKGEMTTVQADFLKKQSCLILTNKDQISFSTRQKYLQGQQSNLGRPLGFFSSLTENELGLTHSQPFVSVGKLIRYGEEIANNLAISDSGQIIQVEKTKVILRKAKPILFSSKGVFYVHHGDFVEKNSPLITLFYQRLKTGDIVQGIPKIEQLFEARQTKEGQILPENLHDKLREFFERYKHQYNPQKAARKSLEKIQQILVDDVQKVYQSQGVSIADKHIEVIVRQMTSKIKIIEGGQTGLLRGELIDLDWIEIVNKGINSQKAEYEPIILGITKAALETESFISAASFQETTRILAKAAIERKTDFLRGLKENVILGHLIPAGTGFSLSFDPKNPKYSKKKKNTFNLAATPFIYKSNSFKSINS